MVSFTGDVPDWFHRIKAPAALRPACVFEKLTVELLRGTLAGSGEELPVEWDAAEPVSLGGALMGWSWGTYVAHTLTLAMLEQALKPWKTKRLAYGPPTPQPSESCAVQGCSIDDLGEAMLEERKIARPETG